jgi:hypothetical protein
MEETTSHCDPGFNPREAIRFWIAASLCPSR